MAERIGTEQHELVYRLGLRWAAVGATLGAAVSAGVAAWHWALFVAVLGALVGMAVGILLARRLIARRMSRAERPPLPQDRCLRLVQSEEGLRGA